MGKAAVCLLWAVLIAGPAVATPITYNYTTGQITVTAVTSVTSTVVLSATVLPVNGVFVTFDAMSIDLTNLLITVPTTGTIPLDIPYGGFDQFVINSASIAPGVGYMTVFGQNLGGGFYSFAAGPLDINGVYSASDSNMITPPVSNMPVPFTDTSYVSGSININTGTLTLSGITLTTLPGIVFGEAENLSLKADIVFVGYVVPEPSTAALVGLGLLGLASSRRRNFLK